jgi:hypothetical protein
VVHNEQSPYKGLALLLLDWDNYASYQYIEKLLLFGQFDWKFVAVLKDIYH